MIHHFNRTLHSLAESYLIPSDAHLTKACFSRASDLSHIPSWKKVHYNVFLARGMALLTPLLALGTAASYGVRGLAKATVSVIDGQPRKAVDSLKEDGKKTLQSLALVIASSAYAVLALAFGSSVLDEWNPNNHKNLHEHNATSLKNIPSKFDHFRGIHSDKGKIVIDETDLFNKQHVPLTEEVMQDIATTLDHSLDQYCISMLYYLQAMQSEEAEPEKWEQFVSIAEEVYSISQGILSLRNFYAQHEELNHDNLDSLCDKVYQFRTVWRKMLNHHAQYKQLMVQAKESDTSDSIKEEVKLHLDQIHEYLLKVAPANTVEDVKIGLLKVVGKVTDKNKAHVFQKEVVIQSLNNCFGERVVSDVLKFYHLEHAETIPLRTLRALFIGIQANLTMEDLRHIYDQRDHYTWLFEMIGSKNFPKEFDALTQEEMYAFLKCIRQTVKSPVNFKAESYAIQFTKDINFLKNCQKIELYKQPVENDPSLTADFKEFRHAEFMARSIIYNLFTPSSHGWNWNWQDTRDAKFSKGVLFPTYDSRVGKEPILMEAHGSFHRDGLYAINVMPSKPVNHEKYGFMGATIFRGTHDWASVARDIDLSEKVKNGRFTGGPGRSTFNQNEEALISALHRDLNDLYIKAGYTNGDKLPLSWDFTGHSLGATDAQRMMAAFAKNSPKSKFDIRELNLWTFNGPRVEQDMNRRFLDDAKNNPNITFRLHHSRTDGDIVQTFGQVLLGHHVVENDLPDNVKVSVVTFDRDAKHHTPKDRHSLQNTSLYYSLNDRYPVVNNTWVQHVATNDETYARRQIGPQRLHAVAVDRAKLVKRLNGGGTPPPELVASAGTTNRLSDLEDSSVAA